MLLAGRPATGWSRRRRRGSSNRPGFARGYGDGRVGLSNKHTLALVNRGGATTTELVAFAAHIRDGVRARFGVTLDVEPALVGVAL